MFGYNVLGHGGHRSVAEIVKVDHSVFDCQWDKKIFKKIKAAHFKKL